MRGVASISRMRSAGLFTLTLACQYWQKEISSTANISGKDSFGCHAQEIRQATKLSRKRSGRLLPLTKKRSDTVNISRKGSDRLLIYQKVIRSAVKQEDIR
jgi:hypothetical protein